VANVQDGYFDLTEIKQIEVPPGSVDPFLLQAGDVLLCEGNSAELVGRPALWAGQIPGCVHQNHVLRVRTDRDRLLPEYLLAYMQTVPARSHFRRRAKKTTNLATINSTDVRELAVPLPSLPEQEKLADVWVAVQTQVREAREKVLQEEAKLRRHLEVMISDGVS
jgi:type I restriction enzyme S subunit